MAAQAQTPPPAPSTAQPAEQRAANTALRDISDRLRNRIESMGNPDRLTVGPEYVHSTIVLPRFYEERFYQPAWIGPSGLSPQVGILLDEIRRARSEGLVPGDYHLDQLEHMVADLTAPPTAAGPDRRSSLTSLDLLLTDAFLLYASDLLTGHVDPVAVDPEWHANRPEFDAADRLESALSGPGVTRTLNALRPRHPDYARLKQALATYRGYAATGGWPFIQEGPKLEQGMADERVRALRARLIVTGDLGTARPDDATRFDEAVETAVRRFQTRHGLEIDGVVGPATLAALNVPAERRVEQIRLNLERWRWLPADLGDRYVLVNIPAFRLDVYEGGRSALGMRVIVGRDYRRTPVFTGSMTYLVLNPYWNVPHGILRADILPRVKSDPQYLAAQNMRLLRQEDGRVVEVDPTTIDWPSMTAARFPYRLRQEPGPSNALGRVKFMFPNDFDVYLHDTPSRDLFARASRTFSSGCIRIEHPLELAAYLLREDPRWTREALTAALATARDQAVRLPRPIPVHLLYWTAWADGDGMHFREDIYRRDPPLAAALAADPPAPAS